MLVHSWNPENREVPTHALLGDPPSTTIALCSSSTLPLRVERASEEAEMTTTAASRLSPGALMLVVLLVARERLARSLAGEPGIGGWYGFEPPAHPRFLL